MTTSKQSPIRLDPVAVMDNAKLYLTICPGKKGSSYRYRSTWNRDLDNDFRQIKDVYNVNVIFNLLEDHEFQQYNILDYFTKAANYGFTVYRYPIKDMNIPTSMIDFHNIIVTIYQHMKSGHNVVVHCIGGLGRSGTIAAGLMVYVGYDPNVAINTIQRLRKSSIKRKSQQTFVRKYAQSLVR